VKIYIFVDMEGISGISGGEFVVPDGRYYSEGRRYYTWDINVCAGACFDAGAEAVIVRDGHSSGHHAILSELDQRVEVVQGKTERRMPGVEECDALILLGYHAMAGTQYALLDHTYSSGSIQNMWMNGRLVGEIGIDAAIAADYGVPTIMVSGDDKACREAESWIPGVIACQVKVGTMCQGARMLSLDEAHKLIEAKTKEAIGKLGSIKPLEINRPVTIRKEMIVRGTIPRGFGRPEIKIIDGRTYEATTDKAEDAFYRLL
jgi:D-amino peptidase